MFTKRLFHFLVKLLLIVGILTFNSCDGNTTTKTVTETNDIPEKQEVIKTEKPEGTISVDTAKAWEKTYCNFSIDENSRTKLNYVPNREFYFSLERMKQYISYVEEQAKLQNYENLGFRIYLGVRPPKGEEKMSQETIFIAPTTMKTTNNSAERYSAAAAADTTDIDNIYSIEALNLFGSKNPPKTY